MEQQLNISSEQDNVGVEGLMEWIRSQPHLPRITEKDVKKFLHCNYDDVDAAKKTIENYYTFRTRCTEFFLNRDIDDPTIQAAMNLMMFAVLPKSTPEGYRIAFCRLIDYDTTNYVYLHTTKLLVMCLDLWMKDILRNSIFRVMVNRELVFRKMARQWEELFSILL
ncbi:uncharacterized protein LOC128738362 isoform X2 [Sabethes cyaneus]|uniref:uncharacterized protein LOC128738362 isoform X2 n=1 Tax=Sabethes cyaneus TaxID=53552 RepID=UPI00237E0A8D|nr:uncharacterized protein LOC128738362 isoform X2 [Sabethes cyaneus]